MPGDDRGWVEAGRPGIQLPDPLRKDDAERRLAFEPIILDLAQRSIVHAAIDEEAAFRGSRLHARNARTNHVHIVVTSDDDGKKVRDRFKSWCSRRLNETYGKRPVWWTRGGSVEQIWDEPHFDNVVRYVVERQ